MKTAISYRNISELARPDLKGLIGNLLDRHLQPHLSHFPAELVRLRATLERSGHRSLYRARLRLGLPSATLACSDESPKLGKALELSFAELERQLEHHIAHLRHEDNWRRKERRAGLRRLKGAATGPAGAGLALFSELVRPLLPELKRFTERTVLRGPRFREGTWLPYTCPHALSRSRFRAAMIRIAIANGLGATGLRSSPRTLR
ncbi:hypothetical protein SAMN05192539_102325 [Paraburkholderia diazotrophica]|uniref:Uncharacterized protein n=1 Tax=Paraburkholderia diazotrophica TaxID=667676 RepID=A0A1H7CN26_9BURK|nr:hypothetical protein SAMN05192539_102325 [Paraburkholderia diazotrophica]